jgi:hypothetical protein
MVGSLSRRISSGGEPCLASDRIVTYSKTPAFGLLGATPLQAGCKEDVYSGSCKGKEIELGHFESLRT